MSSVQSNRTRASGFYFPPTALADAAVKYLVGQRLDAVNLYASVAGLWVARMRIVGRQNLEVSPPADGIVFFIEYNQRGHQA